MVKRRVSILTRIGHNRQDSMTRKQIMDPKRPILSGGMLKMIAAYLIGSLAMAGVLTFVLTRRHTTHMPILSVLVLPFSDPSTPTSQNYLGEGLSAVLATQLGELDELDVPSADLSSLLDPTQSSSRLAARLALDLILDGSLEIEGGAVEIELRLIEPGTFKDPRIIRVAGSPAQMIDLELELLSAVTSELQIGLSSQQGSIRRSSISTAPPSISRLPSRMRSKASLAASLLEL